MTPTMSIRRRFAPFAVRGAPDHVLPVAEPTPDKSTVGARLRGDDGVALVEFAIVAPVLFMLLFGMIDFGWQFAQLQDVRQASREGARMAVVNAAPGAYPSLRTVNLEAAIKARMVDVPGTDPRVKVGAWYTPTAAVADDPRSPAGAANVGDLVTVCVSFPGNR